MTDQELIESYVAEGFDRKVAETYVNHGRTPPSLDQWLALGVPSRDRHLFKDGIHPNDYKEDQ